MSIESVLKNERTWHVEQGEALNGMRALPGGCVQCALTSTPYFGLRSYLPADHPLKPLEIGCEKTPSEFVTNLVNVFCELHRVLRDDGLFFLNIGDSYCSDDKWGGGSSGKHVYGPPRERRNTAGQVGCKPKDQIGVPHLLAFALRDSGWYWRDTIIWAKPNAMPGSQDDRCTSSFEYVFQFSKSARYFSDFEAIKTPPRESSMVRLAQDIQSQAGSNRANGGAKTNGTMKAVGTDKQRGHSRKHAGFNDRWDQMEKTEQQAAPATMRNVWFISTASYSEAHFAVMPDELARRCILAGTSEFGSCDQCGAPFTRMLERNVIKRDRPNDYTKRSGEEGTGNSCANSVAGVDNKTIGWEPSCDCVAPMPIPCLVLDPFSGAGTTVMTARRLGLRAIGFELNPEYAEMSRRRIREDQPLLNAS